MMPIDYANDLRKRWVLSKFRLNIILYRLLDSGCARGFDYLEPKEKYAEIHVALETRYCSATKRVFDSELNLMVKEGLITSSVIVERDGAIEVHLDLVPPSATNHDSTHS